MQQATPLDWTQTAVMELGLPEPTGIPVRGTPSLDLFPGASPLPEYTLVDRLGEGGFGQVWRALGPGAFPVALKFIPLDSPDGRVEERALEAVRRLRHAHLLGMFGAWRRGRWLVLAMELADGTLLDRWNELARQGTPLIPPEELHRHIHEAARGLDFLNRHQVVHRDVKPQNLLLVGDSLKVADFGLAKMLRDRVTPHTGFQTPAYAAPEFFSGQANRSSDQYSLAVTYYHLRTGRLPFGGSPAEMMTGHLHRRPDLEVFLPAERLVVARALAKCPEQRWPSCAAFAEALVSSQHGPRQVRSSRPWMLATAALVLSLSTGASVVSTMLLLREDARASIPAEPPPAAEADGNGQD